MKKFLAIALAIVMVMSVSSAALAFKDPRGGGHGIPGGNRPDLPGGGGGANDQYNPN
ncbi:hypothetical protein [Brevibacillus sp. 179-C9.3 HS]|uniref:hypothetical protein n=1 Tax=unclassified Brevibacillus TaxID=2684853 RepID=UPI0039A0FEAC